MSSTSESNRGTWATYSRAAREAAGLSKVALGRRLGLDRGTIHRWETGATRPDSGNVVAAFADLFGLDLDEALAASGLRPTTTPPAERPTQQRDPVIQWILDHPAFDEEEKVALVKRELARIERERADRIAELQWIVRERERRDGRDTA